jgi:hypothetical protein
VEGRGFAGDLEIFPALRPTPWLLVPGGSIAGSIAHCFSWDFNFMSNDFVRRFFPKLSSRSLE